MQTPNVNSTVVFRNWLAVGLVINLLFTTTFATALANQLASLFGPAWLWLVAIPLASYALIRLPSALKDVLRKTLSAWRWRRRVQAVRVRRPMSWQA